MVRVRSRAQLDADAFGYGPADPPEAHQLNRVFAPYLEKHGPGLLGRAGAGLLEYAGRSARNARGLLDWFGTGAGLETEAMAENAQANNARIREGADAMGLKLKGGKLTPEQEKAIQENPAMGFGTADLGAIGGFAGTFAGVAAKTADKAKLALAEALEKAGAGMERIRQETGWFKLADNQWRFEIPDNDLRIIEGGGPVHADPEIEALRGRMAGFSHPELEQAYPWLRDDTPIDLYDAPDWDMGYAEPYTGGVGVNRTLPPVKQRGVLAHELQHKIQQIEGFSPGANPSWTPEVIEASQRQILAMQERAKATVADYEAALKAGKRPSLEDQAAYGEARELIDTLKDPYEALKIFQNLKFDNYLRAHGEVEARSVEDRVDFTPEQRRATAPFATQGARPEDTLVIPAEEQMAGPRPYDPWGPVDPNAPEPEIIIRDPIGELPPELVPPEWRSQLAPGLHRAVRRNLGLGAR